MSGGQALDGHTRPARAEDRPLRFRTQTARCPWLLVVLILSLVLATQAEAERRIALVVGINSYDELRPLRNAVNDARDVAAALARAGYEVDLRTDIDRDTFFDAADGYFEKLQQADLGFFYYAGHGMEVDGENYLIPRDARIGRARWLAVDSVPLLDLFRDAERTDKSAVFFVDACRNDPFSSSASAGRGARPIGGVINAGDGFNKVTEDKFFKETMDNVGAGSSGKRMFLVAMSTDAGRTADDGAGRNSPFAEMVVNGLANRNASMLGLLENVMSGVRAASEGRQKPYYALSNVQNFSLWPTGR